MLKLRGFFAWALIAMAVLAYPGAASAETNIGVVDMQKVLTESKAAINIQGQVQAYREKSQAEIGAVEQKLRDEQQALAETKDKIPADEFAARKQAFEQNLGTTRNMVQGKKRALDEAFAGAMKILRDRTVEIVAQIAEQKGYDIILTRQNVVLVGKELDITADVLARIDAEMTEIQMEITSSEE